MTMTQMDDTMRKITLGDPDGPIKFIDYLGMEVPTYLDPREDLIVPKARGYKRVNHHVPFRLRNEFKPEDWPEAYRKQHPNVKTDIEGFVLCAGITKAGASCSMRAVNRTHFCRSHGGALHPADKKLHVDTRSLDKVPDRVEALSRIAKFYQGFLKPEDLADDEVQRGFVRDDDGKPVPAKAMGIKYEQAIAKELHRRLNDFLKSKAASMLHVMVDIAENDLYEAADRIKAAQWVAERTLGKTPDVILHGSTKAPYESILEGIGSGSREESREARKVAIERLAGSPDEILDVEIEDEDSEYGEGDRSSQTDAAVRASVGDDSAVHETEVVSDSTQDAGSSDAQISADDVEQRRKDKIRRTAEIKRAKQRRFAARATGAKTLLSQPWLIDFKPKRGKKAGYRACLVAPNAQTPAVIERIQLKNMEFASKTDEDFAREAAERVASEAEAQAVRLRSRLAKLEGSTHGS